MTWNGSAFLIFAALLAATAGGFVFARRAGWRPVRVLAIGTALLALLIAVTIAPYGLGLCSAGAEGAVCPLLPASFARAAETLAILGLITLSTAFPLFVGLTALAALFARFRRT